jgi:hypothetical protein
MSHEKLLQDIQHAQVLAAEDVVMRDLEAKGLAPKMKVYPAGTPYSLQPLVSAIDNLVNPSEEDLHVLLAAIRKRILNSGWSHTDNAIYAAEEVNDAIYYLKKAGE